MTNFRGREIWRVRSSPPMVAAPVEAAAGVATETPATTTSAALIYPAYFGRNRERGVSPPPSATVPPVKAKRKAAATGTANPVPRAPELRRSGEKERFPAYDRETGFPFSSNSFGKKGKKSILLGRFEVRKMLGRGTFAKVYLAQNIETDELVAIKALDKELVVNGGLVNHIKQEITALRSVQHPNVVRLHEVMATKAKIYIVMEYVRGGELFSRFTKGRLREETARKYFQQLISAVAFCHSRGIFHRDLKPENLLVDEHDNLKVSDFGLSAVSERSDGLLHTFCGTPAYIAPEVLAQRGYRGAQVDIWSCGVILYMMIAGRLPFFDRNIVAMYKKIHKGEFRCPRWFSPELVSFLHRLLKTDPTQRITTQEIIVDPWFKKGYKPVRFYYEDDQFHPTSDSENNTPQIQNDKPRAITKLESQEEDFDNSLTSAPVVVSEDRPKCLGFPPRPPSLNAFDIISFSRGFDLSGLFDQEVVGKRRFLSREPVPKIIARLEEIAKEQKFRVRRKNNQVNLEGRNEDKKGPLMVSMEISEMAPGMVLMEVSKKSGDKQKFNEFYRTGLKPGLRHLMSESPPISLSPSPAHFAIK